MPLFLLYIKKDLHDKPNYGPASVQTLFWKPFDLNSENSRIGMCKFC